MTRARAAIALTGLLALSALAPSAGASSPDPFHGAWQSIDAFDDSSQTLSFGGGGATRRVHLFDNNATGGVCASGPASARGTGEIDGNEINVVYDIRCADGNSASGVGVQYVYDPDTDTLSDTTEVDGEEFVTTWERPSA